MLPSMVVLIRQIVQVLVRHTGTGEASYQLGQLLLGPDRGSFRAERGHQRHPQP